MLLIQSLTSALVFNYIQHLSESRWTWWFVSILTYTNVNASWRMKSCIMVPYLWKVRRLIYQFFLSEKQSQPPMNETNISMSFHIFKGVVFLMCFSCCKKTEHWSMWWPFYFFSIFFLFFPIFFDRHCEYIMVCSILSRKDLASSYQLNTLIISRMMTHLLYLNSIFHMLYDDPVIYLNSIFHMLYVCLFMVSALTSTFLDEFKDNKA